MYQWYQNAQVCYAYLSDVVKGAELSGSFRQREFLEDRVGKLKHGQEIFRAVIGSTVM
jgi:hypothetical protein